MKWFHVRTADLDRVATPGRMLLDIKRSGQWKARAVKQGFREDKASADGPDFSYYSNVVKFAAVCIALARRRKGERVIYMIDISTAFLQSHPYPEVSLDQESYHWEMALLSTVRANLW